MSEEINTQQQTQQDPTPGAKGGRTFTQDDVNRIVSERLAHERALPGPLKPAEMAH